MKQGGSMKKLRTASILLGAGMVLQFPGCNIGEITASTTIDGRTAIISLLRGALLDPIDAALTNAINEAFDELVDEDDD